MLAPSAAATPAAMATVLVFPLDPRKFISLYLCARERKISESDICYNMIIVDLLSFSNRLGNKKNVFFFRLLAYFYFMRRHQSFQQQNPKRGNLCGRVGHPKYESSVYKKLEKKYVATYLPNLGFGVQ